MSSCSHALLIGGHWVDLHGVIEGIDVQTSRPSSDFVSMNGTRTTQIAQRSNRQWGLRFDHEAPDVAAWLRLAAQGRMGDVWLLDVAAARANMLRPEQVSGRARPDATWVGLPASPSLPALGEGHLGSLLVRQLQPYWLGGWTIQTAGEPVIDWSLSSAAESGTVLAPAGSGPRRWSTSILPPLDDGLSLDIPEGAGEMSTALRLTEGSVDGAAFVDGQHTPCKVRVSDPSLTLNYVLPGQPGLGDYSFTLHEVGR